MLFSPGKVKICELPLKDPNEMLVANRGKEIVSCIWQAKDYTPDGIIEASQLLQEILIEHDCNKL